MAAANGPSGVLSALRSLGLKLAQRGRADPVRPLLSGWHEVFTSFEAKFLNAIQLLAANCPLCKLQLGARVSIESRLSQRAGARLWGASESPSPRRSRMRGRNPCGSQLSLGQREPSTAPPVAVGHLPSRLQDGWKGQIRYPRRR